MSDPSKIDIDYVANLARIELTNEEKKEFSSPKIKARQNQR